MHEDMIRNIVKRMPSHGSHREPFNYNDHLLDALHYSDLARPRMNCYDTVEINLCERRYRIMESRGKEITDEQFRQKIRRIKQIMKNNSFELTHETPDSYIFMGGCFNEKEVSEFWEQLFLKMTICKDCLHKDKDYKWHFLNEWSFKWNKDRDMDLEEFECNLHEAKED